MTNMEIFATIIGAGILLALGIGFWGLTRH